MLIKLVKGLKEDIILNLGWYLNSTVGVFTKGEVERFVRHRDRINRKLCEEGGKHWMHMSACQEMPKITDSRKH